MTTEGAALLRMIEMVGTRRMLDACAHLPHPFVPSGEYAGVGLERCAVCRMVQRGTYIHPDERVYSSQSAQPTRS